VRRPLLSVKPTLIIITIIKYKIYVDKDRVKNMTHKCGDDGVEYFLHGTWYNKI